MAKDSTVAFISGGNRGIGLDTARQLGRRGITVVIGARDPNSGEAALIQLRSEGITAELVHYDAGDPATIAAVREQLQRRFGRLDILVNNAGTIEETLIGEPSASTVTEAKLRATFETNFFAVVRLTQELLPLLRESSAGRIVNVTSVLGSLATHSLPDSPIAPAKPFAYNASKTALNAFTVHLADELRGTRIKVNSAHPGWVKTGLGGPHAPAEIEGSGKTSARLATLGDDGPTGGFFDGEIALPW